MLLKELEHEHYLCKVSPCGPLSTFIKDRLHLYSSLLSNPVIRGFLFALVFLTSFAFFNIICFFYVERVDFHIIFCSCIFSFLKKNASVLFISKVERHRKLSSTSSLLKCLQKLGLGQAAARSWKLYQHPHTSSRGP